MAMGRILYSAGFDESENFSPIGFFQIEKDKDADKDDENKDKDKEKDKDEKKDAK